jgi:hypothetical protein
VDNRDRYSIPELKNIYNQYHKAYTNGFRWHDKFHGDINVTNMFRIAEMRVDFMRAKEKCGLDFEKMKAYLNGELK